MLKLQRNGLPALMLIVSAIFAGCGGGGSSNSSAAAAPAGPVTSTLAFPLQTAYSAIVANGLSKTFTVTGTCNGSGSRTSAAANTGAAFEGKTGMLSAVTTQTITYTNCTPTSNATTTTSYFDTNYVPLGFNSVGSNYAVWPTPPNYPASIKVGDTTVVGTENLYTDSTKATSNGKVDQSFVVEADTATTAIVNLISKIYNAAGTLTSTEQSRYRIAAVGALAPISTDVQFANGSTNHLVLTYN